MSLSMRELEVMALVVSGLSNEEVANKLFVTEKTIKFHLTKIYEHEGVTSRAQLIVKHLRDNISADDVKAFREILK